MNSAAVSPILLPSIRNELDLLTRIIQEEDRPLRILEAGSESGWPLELLPKHELCSLDGSARDLVGNGDETGHLKLAPLRLGESVLTDVRNADFEPAAYDVIYSSFVLEHLEHAERVLDNFCRWLKPAGLLILRIPDPDAAYGFASRTTPRFGHILYRRFLESPAEAGGSICPLPVVYDPIVSLRGIGEWATARELEILVTYAWKYIQPGGLRRAVREFGMWCLSLASGGSLSNKHMNLTFVIRKPSESGPATTSGSSGTADDKSDPQPWRPNAHDRAAQHPMAS